MSGPIEHSLMSLVKKLRGMKLQKAERRVVDLELASLPRTGEAYCGGSRPWKAAESPLWTEISGALGLWPHSATLLRATVWSGPAL
jgi:hypothetical protein